MMRAKNLFVQPSESMSLTSQNGRILLVMSPTGRSVIAILRIAGKGSESKSRAYSMKLQEAYHNTGPLQRERVEADHLRRSWTTSTIVGRRAGSWCQHRTVMFHTESVSPSLRIFSGMFGPPLPMISGTTTEVASSLGVSLPVKTLGRVQTLTEPSVECRA